MWFFKQNQKYFNEVIYKNKRTVSITLWKVWKDVRNRNKYSHVYQ